MSHKNNKGIANKMFGFQIAKIKKHGIKKKIPAKPAPHISALAFLSVYVLSQSSFFKSLSFLDKSLSLKSNFMNP